MSENKKEQKALEKLEKIKQKRFLKENKKIEKQKTELSDFENNNDKKSNTHVKDELKKLKKEKVKKEKIDYQLVFKEAPIKFLKEVNKIKWSSRKNLGTKFLWVIIFIIIFGILFFFTDWGLQSLFKLIKII